MIDLYHGTSTLFLDSILQHGLGGVNPVTEWQLLELSREVYALSQLHLKETPLFQNSSFSFKLMTEQSNSGRMNFQHGDTYLSASRQTAANYAIRKRYGSELLTYTLNFLQELIRQNVPDLEKEIYQKYYRFWVFLKVNPSPILIRVSGISSSILLDEHGNNPDSNIAEIAKIAELSKSFTEEFRDDTLQQINFRLKESVQVNRLKIWLINVQNHDALFPEYNLYELANTAQTV